MANNPEQAPSADDKQQSQQSSSLAASPKGTDTGSKESKKHIAWVTAKEVFLGVAGAAALTTLGYAGIHWAEIRINEAVERKLSDPIILRKIAAESRPMLVFKANESIISDEGASQFVKEIKVTHVTTALGTNMPTHVHIELTKFFSQAPLLTLISPAFCVITAEHGKGLSWEFSLEIGGLSASEDIGNQMLFRLELLP
jgi:hypothetical protein